MQKHWTWIQERPLSKVRFSSHSHSLIMRSESLCRVSQCLGTGSAWDFSTLRSMNVHQPRLIVRQRQNFRAGVRGGIWLHRGLRGSWRSHKSLGLLASVRLRSG